jgi:hypothetical protein
MNDMPWYAPATHTKPGQGWQVPLQAPDDNCFQRLSEREQRELGARSESLCVGLGYVLNQTDLPHQSVHGRMAGSTCRRFGDVVRRG